MNSRRWSILVMRLHKEESGELAPFCRQGKEVIYKQRKGQPIGTETASILALDYSKLFNCGKCVLSQPPHLFFVRETQAYAV